MTGVAVSPPAEVHRPLRIALVSLGHCPSLALRNLRRYLESDAELALAPAGVEVLLFDWPLQPFLRDADSAIQRWSFSTRFDQALDEVVAPGPDIVGFSCYLWNVQLSLRLADAVARLLPESWVLLGGTDVSGRGAEILTRHPAIAAVVEGDGEEPLRRLVVARQQTRGTPCDPARKPPEGIPGVLVRRTPPAAAAAPAASTAPATDMTRLTAVWDAGELDALAGQSWSWPHVLYETLRGCPYACSYCMYGKTPLNAKEEGLVVSELLALLRRGLAVEIIDPTFTTYVQRAKRILAELARHDYRGTLYFEAYPDSIDGEMADLLAAARVTCVGLGLQTISSQGLREVRRPENRERFERAIAELRRARVRFYVDIIYGLPGTRPFDFFATVEYLAARDCEIVAYRLLGLPGSPLMRDAERFGMVFSSDPPYELLRSDTFSLADLRLCERFYESYLSDWSGGERRDRIDLALPGALTRGILDSLGQSSAGADQSP